MKAVRWFNRHIWFFPMCALLITVLLLVFCIRPLLRQVDWPRGVYLPWLLSLITIGVLTCPCIWVPRAICRWLRIRLVSREIQEESDRESQTCDPEPLLLVCRELQAVWLTKPRPELRLEVQLVMADAAGRLGRIQEAEQELGRVLPRYEQYPLNIRLAVELCAATIRIWAHKFGDAHSFLMEAERHLTQMTASATLQNSQRAIWEDRKRFYLLMAEGGTEELLADFQQNLAKSANESLMSQVSSHMNIARCLLNLNRPEEARPHLEFVAVNGNKLAIRAEAEARLAALTAT